MIFVDWYKPGFKAGGPVTSCVNIVEHFRNDYEFFVVTRNSDFGETKEYENTLSDRWTSVEEGINVFYISKKKLAVKTISKLINETVIDIYYINGIYSFFFSILPLILLRDVKKKIILAPRGMLLDSALSVKTFKKKAFLFIANLLNLYKDVLFHSTSSEEEKGIKDICGKQAATFTVPNIPRFFPHTNMDRIKKETNQLHLVSISRIDPKKNLSYALEVLQKIKDGRIKFDIYGPIYDQEYWRACLSVIEKLPENIMVEYKGSLQHDSLQQVLYNSHFLFFPTRGENYGHIIIESLLCGCPVLTSDQIPWNDLKENKAGWNLNLGDKNSYVDTLNSCIDMNNEEFTALSNNAYIYSNNFKKGDLFRNEYLNLFGSIK